MMVKREIKFFCGVCGAKYDTRKKAKDCELAGDGSKKNALFKKGLIFLVKPNFRPRRYPMMIGVVKRVFPYMPDMIRYHFPAYLCRFFTDKGEFILEEPVSFTNKQLFDIMSDEKVLRKSPAFRHASIFCKSEKLKPYFYSGIASEIRQCYHNAKLRKKNGRRLKSDMRYNMWF
jgi:hypothetical protein